MIGEIYYYKGVNRVKVVTESEGYWIVEALEDFDDFVDDDRVPVKVGERRMVPPKLLNKEMVLMPPMQEHVYERKMEKKLQHMVAEEEKNDQSKKTPEV